MSRTAQFSHSFRYCLCRLGAVLFCVALMAGCVWAQEATVVPHLVQFNGTVADAAAGPTEVVFALYKEQTDRVPLWQETRRVSVDGAGHYAVLLGAGNADGIPDDVFKNGEARWLGVTVDEQAEQPRVLLTSVPYAMKASDAETLGGLPASAFVREGRSATESAATTTATSTSAGKSAKPNSTTITATGAKAGYLPVFTDTTGDLGLSLIAETTKNVGIGTASPANPLSVAGIIQSSTGGFLFPDNTTQVTGVPKCTTAGQYPQWSGTAWACVTPSLKAGTGLSGSYASGVLTLNTSAPATATLGKGLTGSIASNVLTLNTDPTYLQQRVTGTCASGNAIASIGQSGTVTCNPAGSVTSVASGAGLTGGPITSSGTLSIAKGGVTNAMLANPSLSVNAGTGLTGGGTVALGGSVTLNNGGVLSVNAGTGLTTTGGQAPTLAINSTVVPKLDANNNFSGNQSISGNLSLSGTGNGITFPDGTTQKTAGSGGVAGIQTVSNSCNGSGNSPSCSVSCPSGAVLLSGGGSCGGYAIEESWPNGTSWTVGCWGGSGETVTAYAICMKDGSSKSSAQGPVSNAKLRRTYASSARRFTSAVRSKSTSN